MRTQACLLAAIATATALQIDVVTDKVMFETEDNYVSAGMSYFPSNKCNWGVCPWGNASVISWNFSDPRFRAAVSALSPLYLRIGGSEANGVMYDVGSEAKYCLPFSPQPPHNSTWFNHGCLTMPQWDSVNEFVEATNTNLIFEINPWNNRSGNGGHWDPTNARDFINYSVQKGYKIFAYEFGNELSYNASTYSEGFHQLHTVMKNAYAGSPLQLPKVIGPDEVHWNDTFFKQFLPMVKDIFYATTWHHYPLGESYQNPDLMQNFMSPTNHDAFFALAQHAYETVQSVTPEIGIWMGETGGCANSGRNLSSNAFIDAFWYLDSLGGLARAGHKGFIRQTLVGANYELIDNQSLQPNPSFYGALLFKKLMGKSVLNSTTDDGNVRVWAHCSRGNISDVTMLIINFKNNTETVTTATSPLMKYPKEVYLMTATDLHSRVVNLNGKPLQMADATMPVIEPVQSPPSENIAIPMTSYAFVVFKGASEIVSVCQNQSV